MNSVVILIPTQTGFTEKMFFWRESFFYSSFNVRYSTLLCLPPPLPIPLCRRMLGSHPGLLRLWQWQPDALTTRLDLIHKIINFVPLLLTANPLIGMKKVPKELFAEKKVVFIWIDLSGVVAGHCWVCILYSDESFLFDFQAFQQRWSWFHSSRINFRHAAKKYLLYLYHSLTSAIRRFFSLWYKHIKQAIVRFSFLISEFWMSYI